MKKLCFLMIFLLGITCLTYGAEEKEESPFEYNFRWYKNDFKWWEIWHKELYENLGKNENKDIYNAGKAIDSIERLKQWILPEKAELFKNSLEFYEIVKEEVGKGNLRRHDVSRIKSLLKEKQKEFIAKFYYKNIKPEEWVSKELLDASAFEKVDIIPRIPQSKQKAGYRYIAHRYGKIFHKINCDKAEDIKEDDRVYFKTKRSALSSGRKPCRECKP